MVISVKIERIVRQAEEDIASSKVIGPFADVDGFLTALHKKQK